MKHLKRFNEGGDYNDCHLCHGEGKEPSCPVCGKSYLDELDRKKPSDWVKDEDEYPNQFPTKPGFVERRMKQQKEYESKFTISMPVPVSAYELLKNSGVPDENIVAAYTEYVKHSLGLTYGTDLDEFRAWCEESDNLVDFLGPKEKPKFRTLTDEEKEKMMSDALKMSEDQWMKKYPVGDHGDYLRRARTKWNID